MLRTIFGVHIINPVKLDWTRSCPVEPDTSN